jgi:hypothetical protein
VTASSPASENVKPPAPAEPDVYVGSKIERFLWVEFIRGDKRIVQLSTLDNQRVCELSIPVRQ